MDIPALTEKFGPLPVWAYVGIVAGAGFFLMHRQPAAQTINPTGTTPTAVISGSADPTSYDPIAQINAMSAAGVAGAQATTAQDTTFLGNIQSLLKGVPNAPNSFMATLPSGGQISFSNDVATMGNIGTGNGLQSGLQIQGQNDVNLANAQGNWANALAGTQGYWDTTKINQQGFWNAQDINAQGYWNTAGIQVANGGALSLPGPAGAPQTPLPDLSNSPVSHIRATCNVGDVACLKAVAPGLPAARVW